MTCGHHDEDTLALRKLEDLLPRKSTRPTVAIYQLEEHQSRLGRDCLCLPIGKTLVTTWARLLVSLGKTQATIRFLSSTGFGRCYATSWCRYQLMHPGFPTQLLATETQSLPSSFGPHGITFGLGYDYTPLSSSYKKISTLVLDSIRSLIAA